MLISYLKATPVDFLKVCLEERKAGLYFKSIGNSLSKKVLVDAYVPEDDIIEKKGCLKVFDIPEYLDINPYPKHDIIKINTFKGSMINLKNYKSDSDYMENTFSSKRRAQLKTYENRLRAGFDITHKIYYGDISKPEYDLIFNQFYCMLEARFVEKEMEHDEIPKWNYYYERMYPLILRKQALLSVIYESNNPISISLNIVYDKIIFGYMKSHDINFSKFSLGFLDLKYMIRWAFKNNFEIFDFLKGQYDYKSKWTDTAYYFQKHLIYNTESRLQKVMAYRTKIAVNSFYILVRLLKSFHLHLLFKHIIKWRYQVVYKKNKRIIKQDIKYIETIDFINKGIDKNWVKININSEPYRFLKKPVIDYIYHQKEHIKNIKVYQSQNSEKEFLINGTKNQQIITYA